MKFFRDISEIDTQKYIIATYIITTRSIKEDVNLREAAWALAIGQSVGNPSVRNKWETEELFENHSAIILDDEQKLKSVSAGIVDIAFPIVNTDWEEDGISHLLCQLMGGHVDIDVFKSCRLIGLEFPDAVKKHFLGPAYGLTGMRKYTGQYDKPLLGGIVKPKIGITPETLLDMVKQMVDGGVDFIKEDEIMANPAICPLYKRVDMIANYLAKVNSKVVFCHTINCDPHVLTERIRMVSERGGNGVHINVWSGYGAYNSIRKLPVERQPFLHFQSSGAKVITDKSHRFSISWPVICKLATMMGVDTIQTGMIGGYSNDDENEVKECIDILREGNTVPVLSCGFHPGLVERVTQEVGMDYMVNAGGAIHGHPYGTTSGAKAMRQAIDKNHGVEYDTAIEKWGLVK